jgi:hypothetical protein
MTVITGEKIILHLRYSILASQGNYPPNAPCFDEILFPGTLHCEVLLAAIAKFPDLAILNLDEALLLIAKVLISLTSLHGCFD